MQVPATAKVRNPSQRQDLQHGLVCSMTAHHGLKHQAQVAAVVEVAQQADDVALALRVQAAQLPQDDLLGLPRLVPAAGTVGMLRRRASKNPIAPQRAA